VFLRKKKAGDRPGGDRPLFLNPHSPFFLTFTFYRQHRQHRQPTPETLAAPLFFG
jgi:hypothetical protein